MKVVPRLGLTSSIDFITDQALTDDERIVDTRAYFDVGHPYYKNGPIYVSESTVRAMAKALGCVLVPEADAPLGSETLPSNEDSGTAEADNSGDVGVTGIAEPELIPKPARATQRASGKNLSQSKPVR